MGTFPITWLLPASTNHLYAGPNSAAWFLTLAGALSIVAGLIHYFLPDGGAGVIAGLDLSARGTTIVALFAWMGAVQIAYGLAQLAVGLRYRTLVPPMLALIVVERGLLAWNGWFGKASLSGHHPPEHYASPAAALLALVLLVRCLTHRPANSKTRPA